MSKPGAVMGHMAVTATGPSPLQEQLRHTELRRVLPPPATRRELRRRCGVTLAAVAVEVGVQPKSIARWETGEQEPGSAHLDAYSRVLAKMALVAREDREATAA